MRQTPGVNYTNICYFFLPDPTHLPQVVLPRSDGTTRTVSVLDMADQLDAQKETIDELGQSVQAAMLAIKQLQNQDVAFKTKMAIDDSEEEVCTHTTSCVSLFFWVLLSYLLRTTVRIYLHPPHSNPFTFIGMLTVHCSDCTFDRRSMLSPHKTWPKSKRMPKIWPSHCASLRTCQTGASLSK